MASYRPSFASRARRAVSAYLGEGRNRWPAVHRLDAARLYRLALEKGPAGLSVPIVSQPLEQAAGHFAWLGRFFAVDVPASSTRTRERLEWRPRQPGLLFDIERTY